MADQALRDGEGYFHPFSGDRIHYRVTGSGGRHILFLHGFAASLHTWDDLAPFFPADEYTLHLLDLKGHGGSVKRCRGDYSTLHNARIVGAYIRSRGLNEVCVAGHSFGGLVGMSAALDCPQITRLVLMDSPGFPQGFPRFMRILRIPFLGPLFMALLSPRRIARKGLESVFYRLERITERLVERYAAGYGGLAAARALAATVRQMIPEDAEQMTRRYADLTIPVLILWGEHDRIVKPWQGNKLHREITGSRLTTIADCGHNPHEERPRKTANLIRAFLAGETD
ncbi:alpha/beta hydrolase [Geobacter sp. FeAm09]|uniref:alpha/beta fold hydrolase n=1 Tax=Geobacter sp. FeAm09 TaxID=2597769 RepID=UPI0011EDEFC8|nr:alpha/beta hydrolase [Geobacter sp. FeAm09]QEM69240.1 alpha/beta hydrolase [Geobacter sp. FeAm09]